MAKQKTDSLTVVSSPADPEPAGNGQLVHSPRESAPLTTVHRASGMSLRKLDEGEFLTRLDLTTERGRQLCKAALQGADQTVSDWAGREMHVVNFVAHRVVRVDKANGEEVEGPRIVFILADGTRVVTSSDHFWRGFRDGCVIDNRFPPFDPPLLVPVKLNRPKGGNPYLTCEPLA